MTGPGGAALRTRDLIDAAALSVLVLGAAVPLLPVFGTPWAVIAAGVGTLAGTALALLGARLRLSASASVAAGAAAYLVLGPVLARPDLVIAGFIPTGRSVSWLIEASVSVWRELITLEVPVGAGGGFLLAPFQGTYLAAAIGVGVALRARPAASLAALAAPAALLGLATLECASASLAPYPVGAAWGAVAIGWAAFHTRLLRPRRLVALCLCGTVGLGCGAGGLVLAEAAHPRLVLRDVIEPPFDPRDYPSPLAGYRRYVKELREVPLMRVRGLPDGGTVRLATMDAFDGIVWNVGGGPAGEFHRIGPNVAAEAGPAADADGMGAGSSAGRPIQVGFTVLESPGVWLPMVDRLVGIEFGGPQAADLREQVRYNAATGSAVLPQTVPAALEYRVDAVWSRPAGREELATAKAASVPLPPPQSVPDVVRIAASQYAADAATDGQVAMALEEGLRTDGFFSHGQVNEVAGGMASLAGHGADRLAVLLTQTPMVGDAEQYASAMALMARSLGLPARVVLGYAPFATARDDAEATDVRTAGILTLRGDDVGAWVEICFEDLGWVAFHPTPDQDKVPREEEQDQQPEPQPQVVQPPVEEHRPDEPDEEDRELADTRPSDPLPPPTSEPDHRVAIISAVAGTILLALLAPPAAIWLAKAIRARRRERRGPPLRRVSRGWTELLDVTRDLQIALPPRATRNEIATSLGAAYPKVACDLATLAAAADQAVFSFEPVQPEAAGRYWSTLRPARRALRASHSRRRRLRARISLRSLSGRPSRRVPPRPGCAAGTR